MPHSRGDVILVRFPNTDLRTYKLRPALIVQADNLQTGYDDRMVAMITSRLDRRGPTCVIVKQTSRLGRSMGLVIDSVVVLHRIATIHTREIERTIGICTRMELVDEALQIAFGLDQQSTEPLT